MTQLEYARIYNNLYKHLNDFCRVMPCIKCAFYSAEGSCVFEQCRSALQPYVFDTDKIALPAKTADRLADLENRVGRLEELVKLMNSEKR